MVSDALIEGISGAVGGMLATAATYPLITVTSLKITQRINEDCSTRRHRLPGVIDDIAQVCRECGWQRLFAGLPPVLMGTGISQGCYFYLYSTLRRAVVYLQHDERRIMRLTSMKAKPITTEASVAIALLAGAGNVVLTNPIWVVATRMMVHSKNKGDGSRDLGMFDVAKEVWHESGVQGFYRGVGPALVMVSNPTIQNVIFEFVTAAANKRRPVLHAGLFGVPFPAEIFIRSSIAKLGAMVLTYPLYMVKIRMQAQKKGTDSKSNSNAIDCMKKIWEEGGPGGFLKGMNAKLVQSVLSAALLFVVKEELIVVTESLLRGPRRLATIQRTRSIVEEITE